MVRQDPITPEFVLKLAFAAGKALVAREQGHRLMVLIGKGTRISGYMLEAALVAGWFESPQAAKPHAMTKAQQMRGFKFMVSPMYRLSCCYFSLRQAACIRTRIVCPVLVSPKCAWLCAKRPSAAVCALNVHRFNSKRHTLVHTRITLFLCNKQRNHSLCSVFSNRYKSGL